MNKYETRNDVPLKYKWDLTKIYKTNDDFYKDLDVLKSKIEEFSKYETNIFESKEILESYLNLEDEVDRLFNKLFTYAYRHHDEDTTVATYQKMVQEIDDVSNNYSLKTSFFLPLLYKTDEEVIKSYLNEKSLKKYQRYFNELFRFKDHVLDQKGEEMLSLMSNALTASDSSYTSLTDTDMTFPSIKDEEGNLVELTESNFTTFIRSQDRRVRKDAFQTLYKTYKQFINTFASTLSGNINENATIAKIRKYTSTIQWCLYDDELDESIYNNLIETVSNNMNILYKYYALKKEILKLDELHLYDIYTPIVKEFDKKYPYEEAKETVLKALSILGEDYISTLEKGLNNNWVDVYPTPAKRTGGYSGGSYDTEPYILLNYQEKYDDMSTLAHEAGHSMHSYYTRISNPYQYGNYSIFVAEVASTTNEILLAKYLLKTSDNKEEKRFILDKLMNLFKATIYRQTMFAEFEQKIYEDTEKDIPLTADYLSEKYYNLNKKYFGSNVIVDEEIQYEWARIPHFYYNFYVYQYATGLSAACHIANDILSGKENAVENYKSFLKCGSKKNPIDSLKLAGVDLTKKEVVESALNMFNETIEEFKKLTDE